MGIKDKQDKKFDTVKLDKVVSMKKRNSSIIFIIYLFIILLMALCIYLATFQINKRDELRADSRNPIFKEKEKNVVLGTIYAADKTKLAETINENGKNKRIYPQGEAFSHVVGYNIKGKAGLEDRLHNELLKTPEDDAGFFEKLRNLDNKDKKVGNSVVTTIIPELQKIAYEAMGDRRGAVVLMEPSTGKILAMVSKPSFDPNSLEENWDEIVNSKNEAPLLNRATHGLYPPGSTFKVLTVLEYMRENDDYLNFRYNCKGKIERHNLGIACAYNIAHGEVDLKKALEQSCNGAFIEMGLTLDLDRYRQLVESFGFNGKLPLDDIRYNESSFVLNNNSSYGEIMQTVFGQGRTLITPIQNCLIASTIANNGVMMRAKIIDHIEDSTHRTVKKFSLDQYKNVLKSEEAHVIANMMAGVAKNGVGGYFDDADYTLACKTGTAQYNNNENSHNLFIGFAPVENPKIAFSIILEGYEGQSESSIPVKRIARKILDKYLGG